MMRSIRSTSRWRRASEGPALTIPRILQWADAYLKRHDRWPAVDSGPVAEAPADHPVTWRELDDALRRGRADLPGGSSLAKLLTERRGRLWGSNMRRLTADEIVKLARDHHRRTGRWPNKGSGPVLGMPGKTWRGIDQMLTERGDASFRRITLCDLLTERVGRWTWKNAPPLTINQILQWADAHHRRTGRWPVAKPYSGPVVDAPSESWWNINYLLTRGLRSLPAGLSLAKLLQKHRNTRNKADLPPLPEATILEWADAHMARTGKWPQLTAGPVHGVPNEDWANIDTALLHNRRGLRFHGHLAEFLAERRGKRHQHQLPRLSYTKILAWADAHHRRTGQWPENSTVPIPEAPGERWSTVAAAMKLGRRGLRPRYSLARLLIDKRGKRDRNAQPRLTYKQILAWADAHYERTGDWPSRQSGRIEEAPLEKWSRVALAMVEGRRGLRRGCTLVKLLSTKRAQLYRRRGLPLKRSLILEWAARHHELTGELPHRLSGLVLDVPGETWAAIDAALQRGSRGLAAGQTLPELLIRHYVPPYPECGSALSIARIITWAESFHHRVGRWPTAKSAFTDRSRTERWAVIDRCLREGRRGLPAGSSLAKLLREHRRRPGVK